MRLKKGWRFTCTRDDAHGDWTTGSGRHIFRRVRQRDAERWQEEDYIVNEGSTEV